MVSYIQYNTCWQALIEDTSRQAVLAILDRPQAFQSIGFSLQSMLAIAPFFILAIAFAGYAKATGIDAYIARAFSGNVWMTIVAASLAQSLEEDAGKQLLSIVI